MSRWTSSKGGTTAASAAAIWKQRQRSVDRGRLLHAMRVRGLLARPMLQAIALVRAIIGAVRRTRQRRADAQVLLSMSDHMLKDIGISRFDARAMAYGIFPSEEVAESPEPARSNVEALRARRSHRDAPDLELDAAA